MTNYKTFLQNKIKLAEPTGFDIEDSDIHPILLPHQRQVVRWNVKGGRRADFLSFGLGKTVIQLETCRQIIKHKGGIALIVCPLGVKHEFLRDETKHFNLIWNMSIIKLFLKSFRAKDELYTINAFEYLALDVTANTGQITTHFSTAKRKVLQGGVYTDLLKFKPVEVQGLIKDHNK